jgi:hypothetical protein
MARLGYILSGKYSYSVLKDGTEVFSNEIDQVSVPRTQPISLRELLFTSYRYRLLKDGIEVFSNNNYTIYVSP